MATEHDPETYAELLRPHESADTCALNMDAFRADVAEARKQHGIAEVVLICEATAPSGSLQAVMTLGSASRTPFLAATLYRKVVIPALAALVQDYGAEKNGE